MIVHHMKHHYIFKIIKHKLQHLLCKGEYIFKVKFLEREICDTMQKC